MIHRAGGKLRRGDRAITERGTVQRRQARATADEIAGDHASHNVQGRLGIVRADAYAVTGADEELIRACGREVEVGVIGPNECAVMDCFGLRAGRCEPKPPASVL